MKLRDPSTPINMNIETTPRSAPVLDLELHDPEVECISFALLLSIESDTVIPPAFGVNVNASTVG